MASSNVTWKPWPQDGNSFDTASTVVCLASTNVAALAVRLFIYWTQNQIRHRVTTFALCAAHLLMVVQSAELVGACYYGWGSPIKKLPSDSLHTAERAFFASNILLVLVHGFSRGCLGFTLLHAGSTLHAKTAFAMLGSIVLWTIGSLLGIALNPLSGPSYWLPVGQNLRFTVWAPIYLTGAAIDIAIAAHSIRLIVPLQMSLAKKSFALLVFSSGILVNIPLVYGLAYLHQHSAEVIADPTQHSPPFIYTNQAAIAISLWCRALEAARMLGQDMGYATYGHAAYSSSNDASTNPSRGVRYFIAYATGSRTSARHSKSRSRSRPEPTISEDEIELRPSGTVLHTADARRGVVESDKSFVKGIEVSTEYGYSTHTVTTLSD